MTGLTELLKSRRFWVSLIGVIFIVLNEFIPNLAENESVITEAILVIVAMLVGGYTVVDGVMAFRKPNDESITKYDKYSN